MTSAKKVTRGTNEESSLYGVEGRPRKILEEIKREHMHEVGQQ